MRVLSGLALFCLTATGAAAQESGNQTQIETADIADDTDNTTAGKADDAATLETIRVTAPPPKLEDLYRFRNPVDTQGSAFDKYYNEPPTAEEISLNGGYLLYGINAGLMKAAQQVTKLPGWKHQVQAVTARPPPLDAGQMQRAAQLHDEAQTAQDLPLPTE